MSIPELKTLPRNVGTVLAVMDVGTLLLGLALQVSWFFIVLPRRASQTQGQEALS